MTKKASVEPKSNRRSVKNILIHRPMQREFTLITIALMMFSAVVINFLIQHTLQEVISDNLAGFGRMGAYNVLSDASFELITRVTLVMFVTILAVGLFGVFFLHRVAGPVYRFHQLFIQMSRRGEVPQDIALRKGDFFKDTAAELSTVFKAMRERGRAIKEVEEILESISTSSSSTDTHKRVAKARQILQKANSTKVN